MTTLIVGANGATGRLLVEELLSRGDTIKIIVRSLDRVPEAVRNNLNVSVIEASVLKVSDADMAEHVRGCEAVVSCLGHNLSLRGLFGRPRRLVTDATRRLCKAIEANDPALPVKFVLMNTTGNSNRDLNEPVSLGQRCVVGLLRLLLPPHADNESAADYLRTCVGQRHGNIEWVAVRPDGLVNHAVATDYQIHASPTRSAIFDAGMTSRINVAHFMAELTKDASIWARWRGRMPVIYNAASG
ncbi:MAG: NAD(P)-dependent oxidoreductase [Roseobacter sp.]